ncbi:MAG: glycosyltransferase family 2 protein, partial [Alphaproteobacteria bacterium]|nr:glycosyltransferase family 2 protein [Alphaproteobacteria bacterium]
MVNSVTISVVIPMRNERDLLKPLFQRLLPVLEGLNEGFEVICVNDGSTDDTLERLKKRNAKHAAIRIVDLSRGFGKEAALTAGIDLARGRAVVVMDADLQDPPELIADFVAKWREGWQVVYGARRSRDKDSWLKRTTAKAFYAVFNRLSRTPIPPDAGDFRLMDRRVGGALQRSGEHPRFLKGLFGLGGLQNKSVPFDRPQRQGGGNQWAVPRPPRLA